MGVLKFLSNLIILVVTASLLIVVIPGITPHIESTSFLVKHPKREYLDLLHSNNILDEAEVYYESLHDGIESMLILDDDSIVTSDQNGVLYRITGPKTAVNIIKLKYPCDISPQQSESVLKGECSWPLGMRKDLDGNVIFMDFYGGMTKVNLQKGSYENIVPKHKPIDGFIGYVPEDLDVADDGSIYWTDGSTNAEFYTALAGQPSGRLIKYDPVKKTNQVLLNDLYVSNGVCLSENQDFVLVAETGSASIRRYYLKGDKKGTSDTFIDGLPGYPDNIRSNGRGGFFVPLFCAWNDEFSLRTHVLSQFPLLRKFVRRVQYILLAMVNQVNTLLPENDNAYLTEFAQYVQELGPILRIHQIPETAIVVELSNTGKVLNVFHGKSGHVSKLSQISVGKIFAYMTSPFTNKIWRIKLDKLRT